MIVAVVNPKSAKGKAADAWSKVRAFLPADVKQVTTTGHAHAIDLTRAAIKAGAKTIVAVGGDGTINEVVNGFFENERELSHGVRLGIVPHGRGADFARSLKLPLDPERAAAIIHSGEPKPADLLKVIYTANSGLRALRYSINVTSFGMGGLVAARMKRSYLLATLRTALSFRGNSVRLKIDGMEFDEEHITNVAVGNGEYHGGGMWSCPGASVSDGVMDVMLVRKLSLFELIKGIPELYNGRIRTHPKVKAYRAKRLEASSEETVLIEIDGEPLGRLPIEISIVPKAISILMP